jgi:hypothetical protein
MIDFPASDIRSLYPERVTNAVEVVLSANIPNIAGSPPEGFGILWE